MKITVTVGPMFARRDIDWPFPIPPRIGEQIATDQDDDPPHFVKVVEWVPGQDEVLVVAEPR